MSKTFVVFCCALALLTAGCSEKKPTTAGQAPAAAAAAAAAAVAPAEKVDTVKAEAATPHELPEGHPVVEPTQQKFDFSDVTPLEGGLTVEAIYAQSATLAGKEVTLRGKVVKFSANIMGKNWVHVQDGTGADGTNDLTVTTAAIVNAGDIVLVKGTLVTDKDFGYGYFYKLIIEDGEVTAK